MKIKYAKESPRAVCPQRMSAGASGADLYSRLDVLIPPGATRMVPTGIYLEIPAGMEGQVRGRSGLTEKGILVQLGTIDSDYRGEIGVIVFNSSHVHYTIERDQRVAQLVLSLVETAEFEEVRYEELTPTGRGRNGFGHTGNAHSIKEDHDGD